MRNLVSGLKLGPRGILVAIVLALFALSVPFVDAPHFIDTFNDVVLALSVAVITAYAPDAWAAARAQPITRGDILAMGIWFSWFSVFLGRLSILLGYTFSMLWIFRSPLNSLLVVFALIGGVCHIMAPEAIDGRVPKRKWVIVGVIAGVGVAISMALAFLKG